MMGMNNEMMMNFMNYMNMNQNNMNNMNMNQNNMMNMNNMDMNSLFNEFLNFINSQNNNMNNMNMNNMGTNQMMMNFNNFMNNNMNNNMNNMNMNQIMMNFNNFMNNNNMNNNIGMNNQNQQKPVINLCFHKENRTYNILADYSESIGSVITKYINQTNDTNINMYIVNGKKLNESLTVGESGLLNGVTINVVPVDNILGALLFLK